MKSSSTGVSVPSNFMNSLFAFWYVRLLGLGKMFDITSSTVLVDSAILLQLGSSRFVVVVYVTIFFMKTLINLILKNNLNSDSEKKLAQSENMENRHNFFFTLYGNYHRWYKVPYYSIPYNVLQWRNIAKNE